MKASPKYTVREYMGVVILPADRNGSGIRYYARTDKGRILAYTLGDMRRMIRQYVAK